MLPSLLAPTQHSRSSLEALPDTSYTSNLIRPPSAFAATHGKPKQSYWVMSLLRCEGELSPGKIRSFRFPVWKMRRLNQMMSKHTIQCFSESILCIKTLVI